MDGIAAMQQPTPHITTGLRVGWILANAAPWSIWPWIAGLSGLLAWSIYDSHVLPWQIERYFTEDTRQLCSFVLLQLAFGATLGWIQRPLLSRMIPPLSRRWLLATVIGSELFMVIQATGVVAGSYGLHGTPAYLIQPLAGIALSVPQWLLLRRAWSNASLWIPGSAVPFLLPGLIRWSRIGSMGTEFLVAIQAQFLTTGLLYGLGTLVALSLMRRSSNSSPQTQN
jgi:hypothetical protein